MNIGIATALLIGYIILYFNEKNNDLLIQKIIFNITTLIYFVIGVILLLLFYYIIDIRYIILVLYGISFGYNFIVSFLIIGGIKLIHLFSKKTRQADSKYKLSINSLPLVCYGYILLVLYLLW